jgi:methyltransferase (TIGR00027 family)
MPNERPSRTALAAAAHRAIHQETDLPPVFHDPLACAVMGDDRAAAELLGGRAMRAFICARSRLAEDALAAAVGRGVAQYLLLGAGLDSFAWRNPHPGLKVFEADHPATQAWKRQRLAPLGAPERTTFIPVDLERQPLAPALAAAGLDPDQRVFVSWLGVTPYLESETVMDALEALTSLNAGVEVVFDYGPAAAGLSGAMRSAHQRRAAKIEAAGEPWVSGFEPRSLINALSQLGYGHIEDLGPREINARFYDGRADRLRVRAGRVVRART